MAYFGAVNRTKQRVKFIGRKLSGDRWEFSRYENTEPTGGCGGLLIAFIIFSLVSIVPLLAFILALWSIVFFIPPMLMLNIGVWGLLASFYFKKRKRFWLLVSVLGVVYMLFDMSQLWTADLFYEGVSTNTTFFDVVVYINSVAMGVSIYLLAKDLTSDEHENLGFKYGVPLAGFAAAFVVVMSFQYLIRDDMHMALKELKVKKEVPATVDEDTPTDSVQTISSPKDSL